MDKAKNKKTTGIQEFLDYINTEYKPLKSASGLFTF